MVCEKVEGSVYVGGWYAQITLFTWIKFSKGEFEIFKYTMKQK